jgi:hypothetical protein
LTPQIIADCRLPIADWISFLSAHGVSTNDVFNSQKLFADDKWQMADGK